MGRLESPSKALDFFNIQDFKSKFNIDNVNIILQWRAITMSLNHGLWGGWKVETEGGNWNCPFEIELCCPGCGGNAESIDSVERKQEMGVIHWSCQEFMRLCKVHLFNGCHKWQRELRQATGRLSPLGPCDDPC